MEHFEFFSNHFQLPLEQVVLLNYTEVQNTQNNTTFKYYSNGNTNLDKVNCRNHIFELRFWKYYIRFSEWKVARATM